MNCEYERLHLVIYVSRECDTGFVVFQVFYLLCEYTFSSFSEYIYHMFLWDEDLGVEDFLTKNDI